MSCDWAPPNFPASQAKAIKKVRPIDCVVAFHDLWRQYRRSPDASFVLPLPYSSFRNTVKVPLFFPRTHTHTYIYQNITVQYTTEWKKGNYKRHPQHQCADSAEEKRLAAGQGWKGGGGSNPLDIRSRHYLFCPPPLCAHKLLLVTRRTRVNSIRRKRSLPGCTILSPALLLLLLRGCGAYSSIRAGARFPLSLKVRNTLHGLVTT